MAQGTGTIIALNGAISVITDGASTATFDISGTWSATIQIEATINDVNWFAVFGSDPGNFTTFVTFTANGQIVIPCGGYSQVRIRASLFTSGTLVGDWDVSNGTNTNFRKNGFLSSANDSVTVTGSVTTTPNVNLHDGSGNAITSGGGFLNVAVGGSMAVTQSGAWSIQDITGSITLPSGAAKDSTLQTLFPSQTFFANISRVSSSVTSQPLLFQNLSRKGLILYNDSTATQYIKFGTTASLTSFTVVMPSHSYFEAPTPAYVGEIDAISTSTNGAIQITELAT